MVITAPKPLTADYFRKRLENESLIFIPASIDEYWQLVETPDVRFEYFNHQIVASMSYGTKKHETIMGNIYAHLYFAFDSEDFMVYPSNRPLYAAACDDIFNADVHVVQGTVKDYVYNKTMTATENPAIIVEVLSRSTRNYDLTSKLSCYKKIESVEHILFVEQNKIGLTLLTRNNALPTGWQKQEFTLLTENFQLLNQTFTLKDFYKKIVF